MRPLAECRLALQTESVRQVFVRLSRPGRRSGAIMITDDAGALAGIFTDSDLARLLERRHEELLDGPLAAVMTRGPQAVPAGAAMSDAIEILAERKISELPVVDGALRPVGLIDITDVVGLLPLADNGAADEADDDAGKLPNRHARKSSSDKAPPTIVPFRTKT
jgi:arabinose-5-phosphate isomerase